MDQQNSSLDRYVKLIITSEVNQEILVTEHVSKPIFNLCVAKDVLNMSILRTSPILPCIHSQLENVRLLL